MSNENPSAVPHTVHPAWSSADNWMDKIQQLNSDYESAAKCRFDQFSKLPFPLGGTGSLSNTWFFGPTNKLPYKQKIRIYRLLLESVSTQMASQSVQPFWQGSRTWLTDRHTDRPRFLSVAMACGLTITYVMLLLNAERLRDSSERSKGFTIRMQSTSPSLQRVGAVLPAERIRRRNDCRYNNISWWHLPVAQWVEHWTW